jgi:xanthine/CO dehydrogenase XdhC/CoxF family maturation factor
MLCVLTHLTDVQLHPMPFEVLWLLEMLLCYHVDGEDERAVAQALPSPLPEVAQSDAPTSYLETWNINGIMQAWILIATESRKGPYICVCTHTHTQIYIFHGNLVRS